MSVKGAHVEPVRISTLEFQIYDIVFSKQLVALYQISYTETVVGSHADEAQWHKEAFFHGTGHCGCLQARITNPENHMVLAHQWCGSMRCATQGILNHGHLRTMCASNGHFFSPSLTIPREFAAKKSGVHQHLPIFICRARNITRHKPGGDDVYYVANDQDILPFYLAIVRRK
ncbi:hypothetical protein BC939DRAFT_443664 [Gamsiella multidivaricata]|uniref:uncharacterized protein n=1 Tax=Gamsiella multidivaricata TaxID=101098 RepID=UPI002220906D|nr:uncharacterized protein BC939DRAFT_466376 [Gamsiella multidivaricata]XP_051414737.1 uncharacterized protein BC939DRAFT_443664 [Gamsiella multidivaricata]KAG0362969.1 hypothetical protein BGZ54_008396 [Gamsiella multidivaricata]KAI7817337.1 hypothetical protein BC939DRAFT_466376 [Gamsiella multidivaricata]KAI7828129.1 hypothetical protein BC939DRAFT_443664 [Gamsiella multidivaricata]